jgi:hypothetical protein
MRKTALENVGFLENLPLLYRAGGAISQPPLE